MADYREEVERAVADGYTLLLHMTGIDELGRSEHIRVVLLLERPDDGERLHIATLADRDGGTVARIDDLLPGAAWLQRQIHDLFGIRFAGADDRPLIHHGQGHPLRKEYLLTPRAATPWPGALEPGESEASPGRRALLPVGVPDPQLVADPEATAEEIALSATGTRVRRRR